MCSCGVVMCAVVAHFQEFLQLQLSFEFSRNKLGSMADNPAQYQKLLEGLIAQAMFQLCEKECVIKCREEDIDLVKKAIPVAQVRFIIFVLCD